MSKPEKEAIERVLRFLERTRKRWVDAGAPLTTLIDVDHAIDDARFALLGNEPTGSAASWLRSVLWFFLVLCGCAALSRLDGCVPPPSVLLTGDSND